jgi:NagD protein
MDTDILSGLESELDTALVLTGVTSLLDLEKFPYKPKYVLKDVGEVIGIKD